MATPPNAVAQDLTLLTTKLYIPPPRPDLVPRPRLIQRLNGSEAQPVTTRVNPFTFGLLMIILLSTSSGSGDAIVCPYHSGSQRAK